MIAVIEKFICAIIFLVVVLQKLFLPHGLLLEVHDAKSKSTNIT